MSRRTFEHLIPVDLDFQCENARIMVIDDEPIMTRVVERCLIAEGFENILSIHDPLLAIKSIEQFQPDLILLDISMPALDGLQLLELIRAEPRFQDISVVMLSAADKKFKYQALNIGAVEFINKPFEASVLGSAVRKALRVI